MHPAELPYTESNASDSPREAIAAAIPAETAPRIPPPSIANARCALSPGARFPGVEFVLTRWLIILITSWLESCSVVTVVAFTGWAVRLKPMSFNGTRFCNTSRRRSPIFWTVAIGPSAVLLLRDEKIFRGKERIRPVRLRSRPVVLVRVLVGTSVVSADSDTLHSRSLSREAESVVKALHLLLCEYNDDDKYGGRIS